MLFKLEFLVTIISGALWPPCLPDLNLCDQCLLVGLWEWQYNSRQKRRYKIWTDH